MFEKVKRGRYLAVFAGNTGRKGQRIGVYVEEIISIPKRLSQGMYSGTAF